MGRPLSFPDGLPYFSRSLSEDKCRDDEFCFLTPKQRFERLSQQITKTFSLPLTFANPDFNSLRQDQYFGVRHQKVSSSFAAYMLSTGYSAEMTVGSKRTESVSLIFVLDGVMSLSQNGTSVRCVPVRPISLMLHGLLNSIFIRHSKRSSLGFPERFSQNSCQISTAIPLCRSR